MSPPPSPSTSWHSAATSSSSVTLSSIPSRSASPVYSRAKDIKSGKTPLSPRSSLTLAPAHPTVAATTREDSPSSPSISPKDVRDLDAGKTVVTAPTMSASRRSVKSFSRTDSGRSVRPTLNSADVPPVPQLQRSSPPTEKDNSTVTVKSTSTEDDRDSPTTLAYLASSPLPTASTSGFEGVGKIALQSAALKSAFPQDDGKHLPHVAVAEPITSESILPPVLETASPPRYSRYDPVSIDKKALGEPSCKGVEQPRREPAYCSRYNVQDSDDGESFSESVSVRQEKSDLTGEVSPVERPTKQDERNTEKAAAPAKPVLTWKERFQRSLQAYDDPNASSHSLPRFHRIVEPAVLLLPLLASFYLVGSAVIPFEWWRARFSIARVGLAGQSAESDDRIVEGEEVGLFGVWGWCVMNSEEIARCSAAKFGYTMDSLVDDIGFTNFSKGLLNLPNGIFYAFLLHSLTVTLCGLALLVCVYHCWQRHLVNNSRQKAGWLQHGTILTAALGSLAAWIVDKLFIFFVKEKLKLDITRESSDNVVESGAIPPSVAAATILLLWSFGMSLCPNLIVHLRRHHSFVRERQRAVDDTLERGEWENYVKETAPVAKARTAQRSNTKAGTPSQGRSASRGSNEKRRRETMTKPAQYRKRQNQRQARRKAKRATLIQKRRSTWLAAKPESDDDSCSDVSVDDYDDIETKRLEKRWAKEEARKAKASGSGKGSANSGGTARKAVKRLSTWYHGEVDQDYEGDKHDRRRRDTLGRRVSTWFVDLPQARGKKEKTNGGKPRHGRSRSKRNLIETDDEDDSDVDIDHILKLALGDSDQSKAEKDDLDDEEFLEWTDDDIVDKKSTGRTRY